VPFWTFRSREKSLYSNVIRTPYHLAPTSPVPIKIYAFRTLFMTDPVTTAAVTIVRQHPTICVEGLVELTLKMVPIHICTEC